MCIIILVSVNHLKFRYSQCRWRHDAMIRLLAPFLRCMQLSHVSTVRINGRRQHSCLFFCEKPFLVLLLHNISKFSSVLWCQSNVDDIRCGISRHTIKLKNLVTASQPFVLAKWHPKTCDRASATFETCVGIPLYTPHIPRFILPEFI